MITVSYADLSPRMQCLLSKEADILKMGMLTPEYEEESDLFVDMLKELSPEELAAYRALVSLIAVMKNVYDIVSLGVPFFSFRALYWCKD